MTTNINPVSTSSTFTDTSPHGKMSGMMLAMMAFMENYQAVQDYSTKLMGLSETVENASELQSENMINNVIGSGGYTPNPTPNDPHSYAYWFSQQPNIMAKIAFINAYGGDGTHDLSTSLQLITPQLTVANTEYSQVSTYFSGLDNGINQNSSDSTQTLQIDLQEAQSGPLSTLQMLAQVWR